MEKFIIRCGCTRPPERVGDRVPTGQSRKVAMKRMLTTGAIALALALVMGLGQAAAEVRVMFELENSSTGEMGKHISAQAGDKLVLKLKVKNLEQSAADIQTDLTASIPGCVVEATDTSSYRNKQQKKFQRKETVPSDLVVGTTLLLHADVVSSLGNVGSDDASVTLVAGKAEGTHARGGIFERLFLQAMARAILASDGETEETMSESFTGIKFLYR